MADIMTWVTDLFAVEIGHIGAVDPGGTDVTLGLLVLFSAAAGLGFRFVRGIKRAA